MVRIRLRRIGLKGQPSYRIVATDKESPRDGRFLEILGFYNPRTEPSTIQLKEDRIYHWMSNGAQPSESVLQILRALVCWTVTSATKRAKRSIRSSRNLSLLRWFATSARRQAWKALLIKPRRNRNTG